MRVDAANLSDELFESELFGHERGAFTGAISAKKGLLEVAEEGTVYLDEVSSLSPAAQAKFLRVLQEKNFRRLAGVTTHPFRARLIVSSRRDLAALVEQGAFRDDFFYRIDVVSIRLPRLRGAARGHPAPRPRVRPARRPRLRPAGPPLHEGRRGDARSPFLAGERPGAAARRREGRAHRGIRRDRPARSSDRRARGARSRSSAAAVEQRWTLRELTDAYIDETLRRAGGNRSLAAKRLGVSRKFLWERGKKQAVEAPVK